MADPDLRIISYAVSFKQLKRSRLALCYACLVVAVFLVLPSGSWPFSFSPPKDLLNASSNTATSISPFLTCVCSALQQETYHRQCAAHSRHSVTFTVCAEILPSLCLTKFCHMPTPPRLPTPTLQPSIEYTILQTVAYLISTHLTSPMSADTTPSFLALVPIHPQTGLNITHSHLM